MGTLIDITGKKFGLLTIIGFQERKLVGSTLRRFYLAKCECGGEKIVLGESVVNGLCKSCGCLRKRHGKNNPKWTGCGEISGQLWADISGRCNKGNSSHRIKNRKRIKCLITVENAWDLFLQQNRKCALSGIELTFGEIRGRRVPRTASLDRIDSDLDYTKENVQWIHKSLNLMKQYLNEQEFIYQCCLVADYQRNKKKQ